MYPISVGFQAALDRINSLIDNGHHAEALVTSVFTFEKIVMRSLRGAITARGFTSAQAERIIGRSGLQALKGMWDIFDKDHKKLVDLVGQNQWQTVDKASQWRNALVHGKQTYKLDDCRALAEKVREILIEFRQTITRHHGVDPWTRYKIRRVPQLLWLEPSKA